MGGLTEGCKKPYGQQVGCIIKLALSIYLSYFIDLFMPVINYLEARTLNQLLSLDGGFTHWQMLEKQCAAVGGGVFT